MSSYADEVWVDVVRWEGFYQVSNYGRVKTLIRKGNRREFIRKPCNKLGYLYIRFNNLPHRQEGMMVHRVVAEAFIPNPHNLPEVNHKDGNKHNNHVDNLEWCTRGENISHAYRLGLRSDKGEKNSNSKLREEDVLQIRKFARETGTPYTEIAKNYGVTPACIRHLCVGIRWKHLPL